MRIMGMALNYRWRLGLGIAAAIATAIFQLMIPQLLGEAVDSALGLIDGSAVVASKDESRDALRNAALLIFGFSVLRGLFAMFQNYQGEAIGQSIGYQLRMSYYEKLQRLSFSYHASVHTGDLMTRGMLDVEGVRMFVNTGVLRVVLLTVLIGISMYMLVSTDVVLGLLALSFVPFVGWRAGVARLKLRNSWRLLQERLSMLTRVMDENLGGIRVVRAFASQDYELKKFNAASDEALSLANERIGVRVRNVTAMTLAFLISMGLVLWVGGEKVIDGSMTFGELAKFLAFMFVLQMPVRQLGMVVNAIARASTSGTRLFEVLDLEPEVHDRPGAKPLTITDGVLRFEHVNFAYMDEFGDEQVLTDIGFEARPGFTVGIVGPPGCGKSTLAHLIPRFYDVTSGRITIDGQDIRDVTLESLRHAVGVVEQDAFLFTATIENNVAYGDPWANRDTIAGATGAAQLHDYIRRLPQEYDTLVGERGVSLSGGQRQRLSIARSVMLKPAIMVFDDSTAAIDAATEQRIRAALREVTVDRATIIISHRLSSLMHADEIIFMDGGAIVERGTHDELIAAGGHYRDLYELQIRPSDDPLRLSDSARPSRDDGPGDSEPDSDGS